MVAGMAAFAAELKAGETEGAQVAAMAVCEGAARAVAWAEETEVEMAVKLAAER
jgi:hypothetical protein